MIEEGPMFLAENDTLFTGLSGLVLFILIAWAAIHVIRR
jgi:hypothetical protein